MRIVLGITYHSFLFSSSFCITRTRIIQFLSEFIVKHFQPFIRVFGPAYNAFKGQLTRAIAVLGAMAAPLVNGGQRIFVVVRPHCATLYASLASGWNTRIAPLLSPLKRVAGVLFTTLSNARATITSACTLLGARLGVVFLPLVSFFRSNFGRFATVVGRVTSGVAVLWKEGPWRFFVHANYHIGLFISWISNTWVVTGISRLATHGDSNAARIITQVS